MRSLVSIFGIGYTRGEGNNGILFDPKIGETVIRARTRRRRRRRWVVEPSVDIETKLVAASIHP